MTTTATQQVSLDNTSVPLEKRVEICKCNMRIDLAKTLKEPTYQVVLDALALTTCYPAFLITANVLEIYMHQFWFTINKHDSSYRFKIDKKRMTNQQMRDSTAFKTYLAYSTGATSPKMKKKFKKPASPSKKKALVAVDEPADKHVKKPAAKRQSAGVQIRNTPGVYVSKKKAPAKAERSKGIELLSDAALLEEAQLKNPLKRSKRETNIHQAGGSSEGADFETEVPEEPKGKSIDTSEGTGLKPRVPDVSKADSSKSEYES
ncbi:hypothetical protein Tco_1373728 [Tanacetum coccineum]